MKTRARMVSDVPIKFGNGPGNDNIIECEYHPVKGFVSKQKEVAK